MNEEEIDFLKAKELYKEELNRARKACGRPESVDCPFYRRIRMLEEQNKLLLDQLVKQSVLTPIVYEIKVPDGHVIDLGEMEIKPGRSIGLNETDARARILNLIKEQ